MYKPEDFDLKSSDLEKRSLDNLPLSLKQYMESENPGEYGLKRIEKIKNNLGYCIDETPAPKRNIPKLRPQKIFVSPLLKTRDCPKEKNNFGDFDEAKKGVIEYEFTKKGKCAFDCKCDTVQVAESDVFRDCQQLEIDMEISDICFESLNKGKLQLLFEMKVKNFLTEINKKLTEIDEKNQELEECLTTKRQWVNSSAKLYTIALKLGLQIHQMECDMTKIKYEVCGTLPQVVGSAECGNFCCKDIIKKIVDLQGKMDKVRTTAMLKESFLVMCEESKERMQEENKQLKKDIEDSMAIVQKYEAELNKIKKSVCIGKGKTLKESGRMSQPKLFSSDSDSDKNLSTKHSRISRGSSSSPEGRPGKLPSNGRSNKRQSKNPDSQPKPPLESGTKTWPDESSGGPGSKSGRSPSKNRDTCPNRPSKRTKSPPRNTDKCPIFHPGTRSSGSPSRLSSKQSISGGATPNSNLNSTLNSNVLDSVHKSQSSNSFIDQESHGSDVSVSIFTRTPNNNSNITSISSHGSNHYESDNMSKDTTESKRNEINKTGSSTSFDRLKPGFSIETIETEESSVNTSKDPLSSDSVENMKQTTENILRTSSEKSLLSSGKSFKRSSHDSADRRSSTFNLRRSVVKSGEDQTPKPGENPGKDNNVELLIYFKEKLRQTEVDIERFKKDNNDLKIKWKLCQDEVVRNGFMLNILEKERNDLKSENEDTKKKLKKYEDGLRECRAEHSGPELLNQIETLKNEIEKQRGLIKTSEDSNGFLMQQKEDAMNDLRKCQEKLRKCQENIDLAFSGGDSFLTNQLSKLRKENDQLTHDLEDQKMEVNELARQLKNCNDSLEECRRKLKNSESDLAILKKSDQSADRITRNGISDDGISGATFQGGIDGGVNNNPDSNGPNAPSTDQKEIRDQIKKHTKDVRKMRRLYEVLQIEVQKIIKKLYCRPGSDKIQKELMNIYHAIDWMRRRICVCRGEDLDQVLAPKCFKGEDQILHGICFQVTLSGIASLNFKQLIYLHCAVYKRGVKLGNRDCCDQAYDTIRWCDEQSEEVQKSKKSCMKLILLENEMDKTKRILNNLKNCCKI